MTRYIQQLLLDTDWGTYPFATASTVLSGGINHQAGIPVKKLSSVIAIAKAYTTRVGSGPFPTELLDETGELLRKEGSEFGVVTGRPRRCGWIDTEILRFSSQINGTTDLVITKLDILDSFITIKICTGYMYKGKKVRYIDGDAHFLSKVTPVYKTVKGWQSSTKGLTSFAKLPPLAKKYIAEIEKLVGVPVTYVSTGPKTHEIIKR